MIVPISQIQIPILRAQTVNTMAVAGHVVLYLGQKIDVLINHSENVEDK